MTIKQDNAIQLITSKQSESVGDAMRKAGYTDSTSRTPARLTKSKAWQQKLGALAKANDVTIEQYMENLGLGMTAMKQNNFTGEITVDVGMRLAANKQAEKFFFKDKDSNPKQELSAEELKELAEASDEVAVSMLFRKS